MTSDTDPPLPRGDPERNVTGLPFRMGTEGLRALDLRLARAQGQIGGIRAMLKDGRECEIVVHQLVAVSRAVDKVGFLLLEAAMSQCLTDPRSTPADVKAVERLFLRIV